ncbi:SH3 domain-containing protein [Fulvimarina sp. MAC3]|uniref:SH3 domain-containing protein n=1 Tax=Fulvimarina sp. MAC3 TaxID=3148887 RepID=UPI0031FD72F9
MSKPTLGGTGRPNEEMIRDRLRNRRSLYELKRASSPSYRRWGRSFFEQAEDVSRAAPIWQRYPIYGFLAGTLCLAVLFGGAAVLAANWTSLSSGVDVGRYWTAIWQDEDTDTVAANSVALTIASAETGLRSEGGSEPPMDADESASSTDAAAASTPKSETPANPAVAGGSLLDVLEGVETESAWGAMAPAKPVDALSESQSQIIVTDVPSDLGVDQDLITGSLKPATSQPSVASLLDRARDIEARMGAVWPGFISQVAAGIEAPNGSEALSEPIQSDDRVGETAIPVPEFKPLPNSRSGERADSMGAGAIPSASPSGDRSTKAVQPGVANAFVNMRNAPEMEAGILTVISRGEPLDVLACDAWCKVRHGGTEGFVYATFVDIDLPEGVVMGQVEAGSR